MCSKHLPIYLPTRRRLRLFGLVQSPRHKYIFRKILYIQKCFCLYIWVAIDVMYYCQSSLHILWLLIFTLKSVLGYFYFHFFFLYLLSDKRWNADKKACSKRTLDIIDVLIVSHAYVRQIYNYFGSKNNKFGLFKDQCKIQRSSNFISVQISKYMGYWLNDLSGSRKQRKISL